MLPQSAITVQCLRVIGDIQDWVLRVYPRSGCCIRICSDFSIQTRSGFDGYAAPSTAGVRATTGIEHQRRETIDPSRISLCKSGFILCTSFCVSGLCDPANTVHRVVMTLHTPGELLRLLRNVGSKKSCPLAVQRV